VPTRGRVSSVSIVIWLRDRQPRNSCSISSRSKRRFASL